MEITTNGNQNISISDYLTTGKTALLQISARILKTIIQKDLDMTVDKEFYNVLKDSLKIDMEILNHAFPVYREPIQLKATNSKGELKSFLNQRTQLPQQGAQRKIRHYNKENSHAYHNKQNDYQRKFRSTFYYYENPEEFHLNSRKEKFSK